MRLLLCTLAALIIHMAQGVAFANNSADQRYDVQEALNSRADMLKQATGRLSPSYLARVKKADQKWATSGLAAHTNYIMRAYPFYDIERAQAISIMYHTILLKDIVEANGKNIEKCVNTLENSKLFDFLIVTIARFYEEDAIARFKKNIGVVDESFLHCAYDNYDTARDIAIVLGDALLETGSNKSGASLSLGANINRETMECKFRGNVKSFSTSYFYTSILTGNKFFTRDKTKQISTTEVSQGINISSNTIKSYLDFFVIRLDIEIDKKIYQDIYAFQADRVGKIVHRIDSEHFLNTIATQYTFDN